MPEIVSTRYVIEGAEQGAAAVQTLIESMRLQAAAAASAGQSTEGYESALAELEGQVRTLREAQAAQATATQAGAQRFAELAREIPGLASRVAGVSGAVAQLAERFGSESSAGSLVANVARGTAAVASSTAQFASLGTQLGGVNGGVIGAVIGFGLGAVSAAEGVETLEHAAARLRGELEGVEARLSVFERTRAALRSAEADAGLEAITARLAAADEATRANAAGPTADDVLANMMAEAEADLAERPRRRGGRRRDPLEGLVPDEASFEDIVGIGRELEGDRESDRLEERGRAIAEFEAERAKAAAIEELESERRHDAELERIEKQRHLSDQAHQRRTQQLQEETRILEDFGSTVGNVFGQAFGAAISGQEAFDVALVKGTKSALMQYGTTMFAEGIGALLTAAGNIVINPPAAATKAVEGAGKIALGAALGGIGAAIPTPAAAAPGAGAGQERPADRTPSSGGGGPVQIVVAMNGPLVTSSTEAGLGRTFGRLAGVGLRRFGGRELAAA